MSASLITPESAVNQYRHFFGDPPHPEKLKDYTEHHAATFHLPDAYVGSNQQLRETLTNLITANCQSWITSKALPWTKVQGLVVEWDENKFDVKLMQRVPVRARAAPRRTKRLPRINACMHPRRRRACRASRRACAASTESARCGAASACCWSPIST